MRNIAVLKNCSEIEKNVILTPHISGITWGENMHTRRRIVEIFCENLKQDKDDELKKNIIDFGKGY